MLFEENFVPEFDFRLYYVEEFVTLFPLQTNKQFKKNIYR